MNQPEYHTARLLLRRARTDDLPALHRIFTDPRAMRYWSSLPHTRLDQTRQWLAAMIAAPMDTSDDYILVLQGQVIGKAGCWRAPEIGFILHPDAWGMGLAQEALTFLLPRIASRLGVLPLTADVDPRNQPSLKLLARLGFVQTGGAANTCKLGPQWCDSVYLAWEPPP